MSGGKYFYDGSQLVPNRFFIQRGLYPPTFRAAHRKPVRGGRFKVRKMYNRKWRVWTEGKNRWLNKTFKSWGEAINYAQKVAGS